MRIEIDVGAANDPGAHSWLDRILHKIEDGWHFWDTRREPDPEVLKDTSWLRDVGRQGIRVHEMLDASIQRDAWSSTNSTLHGRRVRVSMNPVRADELGPEDATRLAEEPLVILVENRDSDGAFLERVMRELDKPLDRYWSKPGGPIRLDSVGGTGQMPDEVDRRVQRVPYRPRLVVIGESDREGPNDNASVAARILQRRCVAVGVPCWILAKREAENYLPGILLAERPDAGADHARRLEAWDRLNDDQKDFFDMKNGLSQSPSACEEALFDGIAPMDRTILSNGFGPNVHECWNIWKVQAESELRTRGKDDLEYGIDLIRGEV